MPSDVTKIKVLCFGAGSGAVNLTGSASSYYVNSTASGAGWLTKYINVTPGAIIPYVIGTRGANGTTVTVTGGSPTIFGGSVTSSCYCYAD